MLANEKAEIISPRGVLLCLSHLKQLSALKKKSRDAQIQTTSGAGEQSDPQRNNVSKYF